MLQLNKIGYYDDRDQCLELGILLGDQEFGVSIWDQDWILRFGQGIKQGIAIRDWDRGYGLGNGIEDMDYGSGFGTGIQDWD